MLYYYYYVDFCLQVLSLFNYFYFLLILLGIIAIGRPPPNFGDIKLVLADPGEGLYEVQIYFTDGKEEPSWGAICNDYTTVHDGKVICKQAGRNLSTPNSHAIGSR